MARLHGKLQVWKHGQEVSDEEKLPLPQDLQQNFSAVEPSSRDKLQSSKVALGMVLFRVKDTELFGLIIPMTAPIPILSRSTHSPWTSGSILNVHKDRPTIVCFIYLPSKNKNKKLLFTSASCLTAYKLHSILISVSCDPHQLALCPKG